MSNKCHNVKVGDNIRVLQDNCGHRLPIKSIQKVSSIRVDKRPRVEVKKGGRQYTVYLMEADFEIVNKCNPGDLYELL